jgi:CubicO group peptidase (beta-lactamase class C family)
MEDIRCNNIFFAKVHRRYCLDWRENMSQREVTYDRLFTVCLILFVLLAGCNTSSDESFRGDVVKGEIGQKLDTYLSRITPFGFSGALLVAKDGEIILNKGYGLAIRSEDVSNTSDTVFSTGSITKQFTAAGVMKLEMMGKLNTGDLLSKYFDNVPEDKKDITLHHLLTHTSGVVDGVGGDYEKVLRDETMKKIFAEPLLFQPGEDMSYSNAGYSVLAAVIEKVSGQPYEEFLHKNIFIPAGMYFTGYRKPRWEKKVVAHWYVGEKDNGTPLEKPYPFWNFIGNGGILSTTSDMYKWHLALLGNEILSDDAKTKIFTPFLNDYGYGWDILERKMGTLIQHDGGSSLGCSAEMSRYIDAGVVTMLFCNQSYGRGFLFDAVRDKIEALAFGGDVIIPPAVGVLEPEVLKKYEGMYTLESGGGFKVQSQGGVLRVNPDGQDSVNAMFHIKKAEAGAWEELRDLSEMVFKSALSGDFEEIGNVLYNRERMLGFIRGNFPQIVERHKKRMGNIEGVFSSVTLPFGRGEETSVQTFVELKGERGRLYFDLIWRDSKIVGFGVDMRAPDLSIPFLPLAAAGNAFAGYHLDMVRNFQINFLLDEDDQIKGLMIPNEDSPMKALKTK